MYKDRGRLLVCAVAVLICACTLAHAAPSVESVQIIGRCDSFWDGRTIWNETASIWLTDPGGPDSISSVQTTDPELAVHPSGDDVVERVVEGSQLRFTWWQWNRPAPPADGAWQVDAASPGGTTTFTTPYLTINPLATPQITYPANLSVVAETTPTFQWTPIQGSERQWVYVYDVSAGGSTQVWALEEFAGGVTSVTYNSDGTATQPTLVLGHQYELSVTGWAAAEPQGDGVTSLQRAGQQTVRFAVLPPTLTITDVSVVREREVWASPFVPYHQSVSVLAVDPHGANDIVSVTVTDPASGVHTLTPDDYSDWAQPTAYSVHATWPDWSATPPLAGVYTVTVTDAGGEQDTVTTGAAPELCLLARPSGAGRGQRDP